MLNKIIKKRISNQAVFAMVRVLLYFKRTLAAVGIIALLWSYVP